jgi:plastocyanin
VSHPRPARAHQLRARRAPAGAVLAVAVALLTACGGDEPDTDTAATATSESSAEETTESSSSAAETTESEAAGSQTIEVSSVDFSFELAEDSFAPGTYEVTLTNEGGATHDLVVERDGEDVAASEQIGPGESSTFEVTLEEGEYVFYCSVGNHRSMGMEVPVQVSS